MDKPGTKSQLDFISCMTCGKILEHSEPDFLFCERLRAHLLKPYETEKWDACKMLSREPGLESVLTKSSLKIPCHASLDTLLFVHAYFENVLSKGKIVPDGF